MPRLDPGLERWLIIAGWSAIVILWHTTIVALGLAAWRAWRRDASARQQYRAGLVALVVSVGFAAATPVALTSFASDAPSVVSGVIRHVASRPTESRAAAPVVSLVEAVRPNRGVAASLGALWVVSSLLALARLTGGWMLAGWIRRHATPLHAPSLAATVADLSMAWRVPATALLASTHVEAPVVLGHRAPAILLPRDATAQLDADAIAPLVAHELAHVVRRDYGANLAQSVAEAALFFSPGVHWISRRIREAREYCCDDLVVAHCGPRPYVDALTTLASLGAITATRPVLNATGPRLVVRIRRLLHENATPSYPRLTLATLAATVVIAAATGTTLLPLSSAGVALAASPGGRAGDIPMGFVAVQRGAAVAIRDMRPRGDAYCGTATLENRADVPVTAVRFAAYVSARHAGTPYLARGGLVISPVLSLPIQPGASVDVAVGLVREVEAQNIARGQVEPQVMCALSEIRYANGYAWRSEPITIFGPDHADVPRTLVGRPATSADGLCRDDREGSYSEGALVPVRDEPMRFAKCVDSGWVDAPDPAGRYH